MKIQFGHLNSARGDLQQFAEWCRAAEACDFDLIGYGDSATLWMDPFVGLSVAAQSTSRVRIGTTVTNPVTRHPAVMASGMASLQQLSGGRLYCGIGGGDSALFNVGLRPAKMVQLEEYCRAVRGLCAGETVVYQGHEIKMQWPARPVPIWLSAEGPKSLEFAGRIADGVIVGTGLTKDAIQDSIRRVAVGARAAGRDPSQIEMWWVAKPHIARTEQEGWETLRFTLASSANHHFRFTLDNKFVPDELREPLQQLQREYSPHLHTDWQRPDHHAALVERLGLTEFLGRRFSICGPSEQIAERIREIAGYGATRLMIVQLVSDQIGAVRRFSEEVFPLL